MNLVRFEMNVPTEVALQSSAGVAIEGRYGTRMMFNLADGRVMYVPPIVASKIEAEGILPGERFHLCKAAVKIGQKRSVEWLLERVNAELVEEGSANVLAERETPLERDLRASIEVANANKSRVGIQQTPCICGEDVAPLAPVNNGHGNNDNNSTPPVNQNPSSTPTTKLEHALKTAISAAHNAEKFGSELGYVVRFDADAIKSMAITVLINMSERSPR